MTKVFRLVRRFRADADGSGNGSRFGSTTNLDEFTEWQWITVSATPAKYPF